MNTRETIKENLKNWPCFLSLMRIIKNESSRGDEQLIAHAICGNPCDHYKLEASFDTKSITILSNWDGEKWLRSLFFKLAEIAPE